TTLAIARSTDDDIAKTDIMLLIWCTTANSDHQTESDVGKAVQHVSCDACCSGYAVLPVRQDSDDNIMFASFAQCINIVVVVRGHRFCRVVLFVEKSSRSNVLGLY